MVTKAVIESIDQLGNTCTVRLPLFEKSGGQEIIETAVISNTPGSYNGYKVGDVVIVSFENNHTDAPVVMGKLYLGAEKEKADPRGVINVESSTTSKKAELPFDTSLNKNIDASMPNTQATYTSLAKVANAINTMETAVSTMNKDLGNRIDSVITDVDEQGTKWESELKQTAKEINARVTAETNARIEGDDTLNDALGNETASRLKKESELEIESDNISAKVSEKLDTVSGNTLEKGFGWDLTADNWSVYSTVTVTDATKDETEKAAIVHLKPETVNTYTYRYNEVVLTAETYKKGIYYIKNGDGSFTISDTDFDETKKYYSKSVDTKTTTIKYYWYINGVKATDNNSNYIEATQQHLVDLNIGTMVPGVDDIDAELEAKIGGNSPDFYWKICNKKDHNYYINTKVNPNTKPVLIADTEGLEVIGTIEAEEGHIGKFVIGATHDCTEDTKVKEASGIYSDGYTYQDSSDKRVQVDRYEIPTDRVNTLTNGVYVGTDGIRVGNKFSVNAQGVVTARSLVMSANDKDSAAYSTTNLQDGNKTAQDIKIAFNDYTCNTFGRDSTFYLDIDANNSTTLLGNFAETNAGGSTPFLDDSIAKTAVFDQDTGVISVPAVNTAVIQMPTTSTSLKADSFYTLSFKYRLNALNKWDPINFEKGDRLFLDSYPFDNISLAVQYSTPKETFASMPENFIDLINTYSSDSTSPINPQLNRWSATLFGDEKTETSSSVQYKFNIDAYNTGSYTSGAILFPATESKVDTLDDTIKGVTMLGPLATDASAVQVVLFNGALFENSMTSTDSAKKLALLDAKTLNKIDVQFNKYTTTYFKYNSKPYIISVQDKKIYVIYEQDGTYYANIIDATFSYDGLSDTISSIYYSMYYRPEMTITTLPEAFHECLFATCLDSTSYLLTVDIASLLNDGILTIQAKKNLDYHINTNTVRTMTIVTQQLNYSTITIGIVDCNQITGTISSLTINGGHLSAQLELCLPVITTENATTAYNPYTMTYDLSLSNTHYLNIWSEVYPLLTSRKSEVHDITKGEYFNIDLTVLADCLNDNSTVCSNKHKEFIKNIFCKAFKVSTLTVESVIGYPITDSEGHYLSGGRIKLNNCTLTANSTMLVPTTVFEFSSTDADSSYPIVFAAKTDNETVYYLSTFAAAIDKTTKAQLQSMKNNLFFVDMLDTSVLYSKTVDKYQIVGSTINSWIDFSINNYPYVYAKSAIIKGYQSTDYQIDNVYKKNTNYITDSTRTISEIPASIDMNGCFSATTNWNDYLNIDTDTSFAMERLDYMRDCLIKDGEAPWITFYATFKTPAVLPTNKAGTLKIILTTTAFTAEQATMYETDNVTSSYWYYSDEQYHHEVQTERTVRELLDKSGMLFQLKEVKLEHNNVMSPFEYSINDRVAKDGRGITDVISTDSRDEGQGWSDEKFQGYNGTNEVVSDIYVSEYPNSYKVNTLVEIIGTANDTKDSYIITASVIRFEKDTSGNEVFVFHPESFTKIPKGVSAVGTVKYYYKASTSSDAQAVIKSGYPTIEDETYDIILNGWSVDEPSPTTALPYVWMTGITTVTQKNANADNESSIINRTVDATPTKHATLDGWVSILSDQGIDIIAKDTSTSTATYHLKADNLSGAVGSTVNIGGYKEKDESQASGYKWVNGWSITGADKDNTTKAAIHTDGFTSMSSRNTGVYIGTDGINLGGKFIVTSSGDITATGLTVNKLYVTDNTESKNVLLRAGVDSTGTKEAAEVTIGGFTVSNDTIEATGAEDVGYLCLKSNLAAETTYYAMDWIKISSVTGFNTFSKTSDVEYETSGLLASSSMPMAQITISDTLPAQLSGESVAITLHVSRYGAASDLGETVIELSTATSKPDAWTTLAASSGQWTTCNITLLKNTTYYIRASSTIIDETTSWTYGSATYTYAQIQYYFRLKNGKYTIPNYALQIGENTKITASGKIISDDLQVSAGKIGPWVLSSSGLSNTYLNIQNSGSQSSIVLGNQLALIANSSYGQIKVLGGKLVISDETKVSGFSIDTDSTTPYTIKLTAAKTKKSSNTWTVTITSSRALPASKTILVYTRGFDYGWKTRCFSMNLTSGGTQWTHTFGGYWEAKGTKICINNNPDDGYGTWQTDTATYSYAVTVAGTAGTTISYGSLIPRNDASLGNTDYSWKNAFINDLYVNTIHYTTSIQSSDNVAQTGSSSTSGSTRPSGGCFDAGTKILMADYSTKNIEDISIGDKILSYDVEMGIFSAQSVEDVIVLTSNQDLIKLTFDDESVLYTTMTHPFFTDHGWVSLQPNYDYVNYEDITDADMEMMTVGQKFYKAITTSDVPYMENIVLTSIKYRHGVSKDHKIYNLNVSGHNTFITDGILGHNMKTQ